MLVQSPSFPLYEDDEAYKMRDKSIKILLKDSITRSPSDTHYLVKTLKKFPFFTDVLKLTQKDDRLLYQCIQHAILEYYPKGTFILHKNQDVDGFYLIFQGCIRAYKLKTLKERKLLTTNNRFGDNPNGNGEGSHRSGENNDKNRLFNDVKRKSKFKLTILHIMKNNLAKKNITDMTIFKNKFKLHDIIDEEDQNNNNNNNHNIGNGSGSGNRNGNGNSSGSRNVNINDNGNANASANRIGNGSANDDGGGDEDTSGRKSNNDMIFNLEDYKKEFEYFSKNNLNFHKYFSNGELIYKFHCAFNPGDAIVDPRIQANDIGPPLLAWEDTYIFHLNFTSFSVIFQDFLGEKVEKVNFLTLNYPDLKMNVIYNIACLIETKRYNEFDKLYSTGDHAYGFYFVKSGKINLKYEQSNNHKSKLEETSTPLSLSPKSKSGSFMKHKRGVSKKNISQFFKQNSQLDEFSGGKKPLATPLNIILPSLVSTKKILDTINLENSIATFTEGSFFGEEEILNLPYRIFDAVCMSKQAVLYILHLREKEDLKKILSIILSEEMALRQEWITPNRIKYAEEKANYYSFKRKSQLMSNLHLNDKVPVKEFGSFIFQKPTVESCRKFMLTEGDINKTNETQLKINIPNEGEIENNIANDDSSSNNNSPKLKSTDIIQSEDQTIKPTTTNKSRRSSIREVNLMRQKFLPSSTSKLIKNISNQIDKNNQIFKSIEINPSKRLNTPSTDSLYPTTTTNNNNVNPAKSIFNRFTDQIHKKDKLKKFIEPITIDNPNINDNNQSNTEAYLMPRSLLGLRKNPDKNDKNSKSLSITQNLMSCSSPKIRLEYSSSNLISPKVKNETSFRRRNQNLGLLDDKEDHKLISTYYSNDSAKQTSEIITDIAFGLTELSKIKQNHPKKGLFSSPKIHNLEFVDPFEFNWSKIKGAKSQNNKTNLEMKGKSKNSWNGSLKPEMLVYGSRSFFHVTSPKLKEKIN